MVVAVIAVRVVQVPADEIVDVIAVRNGLVPAVGSVDVPGLILRGGLAGRTAVWVLLVDSDLMLVDVALVRVMQVAVMQIIRMPIVAHGDMAAVGAVLMVVIGMDRVLGISHPCGSFPRLVLSGTLAPSSGGNLAIDHDNHSQHGGRDPEVALESSPDGFRAT